MFKLTLRDYIMIGIIAVLTLFLVFRHTNPPANQVLQQHTKDSLSFEIKKKVDSVTVFYQAKIKNLNDSIATSVAKISKTDAKIVTIKQEAEKKTEIAKKWDTEQLKTFFNDRYPTDTSTHYTDSLTLSKGVSNRIAVELISYDAVLHENDLLTDNIDEYKKQISLKDKTIDIKDVQLSTYSAVITDYKKMEDISQSQIKSLNKQVKWQKVQKTVLGVLFIAAGVAFAVK